MKRFNVMYNVGKVKYVVNFHDGVKTHKDGSDFFDIECFKNKNSFMKFVKDLEKQGYLYGN